MFFQSCYTSFDEQKYCKMLNEAALRAEIALLCKHDESYPQRTACHVINGEIAASYTERKAMQCLHVSFLRYNPVVTIVHGEQGSISVMLERTNFDEIFKQQYQVDYSQAQEIFDFYQVGN